jgi:ketosteroid isomerase-like protein
MKRARRIAARAPLQLALPQDEFLGSEQVSAVIRDFGIDHVFSVAPESEWPLIYAGVDRERVRFSRVLTGYLDEDTVRRIDAIVADNPRRTIDIGYRTGPPKPFLGRQAMLKTEIADAVRERAPARGLRADISTSPEDTLLGDHWYRWLASCRYTIGVEGGASVLDRDGSILACTERVQTERPGATFEELEAECFPGEDGKLDLRALSPRHLEACATRTAQILVEGDYNGVLEAGRHYLPLRRDLSNLDAVLALVAEDAERERVAEAAYRDVVASGRWTYRRLVEDVEAALPATRRRPAGTAARAASRGLDAGSKPLLPLASRVLMPLRRRVYGALRLRGYGAAGQRS